MTEQKARKRAIRARMTKTGERYTAASRHITEKEPPLPPRVADPGPSDDTVRGGTGKGWDEWFRILDAWGATDRTHRDIARYLREEQGVSGWWSQSVTVGYERARGMRAMHQTSKGFTVNVSKTVPVPVERLFEAVVEPRGRDPWVEKATLTRRTATPPKSARFDFRDGASRVVVGFDAKGDSKSTVSLMHEGLPDADAVEEMRGFWKERLGRLADRLSKGSR